MNFPRERLIPKRPRCPVGRSSASTRCAHRGTELGLLCSVSLLLQHSPGSDCSVPAVLLRSYQHSPACCSPEPPESLLPPGAVTPSGPAASLWSRAGRCATNTLCPPPPALPPSCSRCAFQIWCETKPFSPRGAGDVGAVHLHSFCIERAVALLLHKKMKCLLSGAQWDVCLGTGKAIGWVTKDSSVSPFSHCQKQPTPTSVRAEHPSGRVPSGSFQPA